MSNRAELNSSNPPRENPLSTFGTKEVLIGTVALLSTLYAVITATHNGIDLRSFQIEGRTWTSGIYQVGEGPAGEYPPFTIVLFSLFSPMAFEHLRVLWLALNTLVGFTIPFLAVRWLGERWPIKTRFYLFAFFFCWAPFRVTLRNGQVSLIVTALVIVALLMEQRKKESLAGLLLGLSLCKYSMTYPFVLYFLWKRQWRILGGAMVIPVALTLVFLLRLHKTFSDFVVEYTRSILKTHFAFHSPYSGSTEIKHLILGFTGGDESLAAWLASGLVVIALISMGLLFRKTPDFQPMHFAVLSLFALWSVYHRTYDSVLCVIPAAVFMDSIVRGRFVRFSRGGLLALGLLVLSIPGFLTVRLELNEKQLSGNILGFIGLHCERIMVFGMFSASLILLWKKARSAAGHIPQQ
jgi:Glycosyltransferase family 87